jgi:hypothetical protein
MSAQRTPRLAGSLVCCALALLLASAAASAAPKVVNKDGVPHVMNPAKPADSATIDMEEIWRIGGYDDEEIFGVITDVVQDAEGNFYLLDSQLSEVKVYSPDGEYLRTIGREGEGPGEFRAAFNLFKVPGGDIGVLQTFPSKVVTLTPNGDPGGEYALPDVEGEGFRVLFAAQNAGDKLALVYGLNQPSESGFTQQSVLSIVDAKAQKETKLHSQSSTMEAATALIAEKEWDSFRNGRWAAAPDGHIYAAPTFQAYEINVWNGDGKLERVIEREYPDHMRSEEEKERLLEIYKGFTRRIPIPNIKYEIEDKYNPIGTMTVRDDGSLWVQTSRGRFGLDDGVVGMWDVFDRDGQFVKQVTLKGEGDPQQDGFFLVGDRLFVVTDFLDAMMALQGGGGGSDDEEEDDEVEPMEVISYRVPL